MLIRNIFALLLFSLILLPSSLVYARSEGIAAIVNEDAISMSDVEDRMKLIVVSSGLPNNQEIRDKLTAQIVGVLIEEQIKMQEARRMEINITQEEIDQGFASIAQQNKVTPEQFREMVTRAGFNIETMNRQIEAQLAWNKVIQQKIRPQITITDTDVENYLERLNNNKGKTEFLAAEIFLPVDDAKTDAETQQLANKLVGEIRGGKAPFYKVAQQFSQAAGASQGGDLGWVQQGQLPEELDAVIGTLKKNDVSAPIRTLRGYHILMLRDMRSTSGETMPSREQIVSTLGLERMERMQRRYYLDLKAAAFIDNRVAS